MGMKKLLAIASHLPLSVIKIIIQIFMVLIFALLEWLNKILGQ